ncbi:MAG: hypothetical protein PHY64_11525, partial [Eubacteriales bacterium]|nr:hypothetical protein [Eubacteriales bacterium]
MMKRTLSVLLLLIFLTPVAIAENAQADPIVLATGCLTEVYGYTQEEADAFSYTVTETDEKWHVDFSPKNHPTWEYMAEFEKPSGLFIQGTTPFNAGNFGAYPGESAVRGGLRAARENDWFTEWSPESRTAFADWIDRWGIEPNGDLSRALSENDSTAAQAVQAFFVSCYGNPVFWPDALTEWRDGELAAYGLTLETPGRSTEAIRRYSASTKQSNGDVDVTEFTGQLPDELAQALSCPRLEGWECLCGAYYTRRTDQNQDSLMNISDVGLLIFERDGTRILVMVDRPYHIDSWTAVPVGEKAILQNRD